MNTKSPWREAWALLVALAALALAGGSATAQTPGCDSFKAELAKRIGNGSGTVTIESVPASEPLPPGAHVVGSCSEGAWKLLLWRGGPVAPRQAAPVPAAAPVSAAADTASGVRRAVPPTPPALLVREPLTAPAESLGASSAVERTPAIDLPAPSERAETVAATAAPTRENLQGAWLQVTLALITLAGVLGAALLGNWDRVFGGARGAEKAARLPAASVASRQGTQSPVISGVGGNVTVLIGAESGRAAEPLPAQALEGQWVSTELQSPYDPRERYRLELQLNLHGGVLLGEVVQHMTAPEARHSISRIVRSHLEGWTLSFDTRSDAGHTEHYQGQVVAGELRLTRANDVPSGVAIEAIVLRRP